MITYITELLHEILQSRNNCTLSMTRFYWQQFLWYSCCSIYGAVLLIIYVCLFIGNG